MKITLNQLQSIVNSRLCITTSSGEHHYGKLISFKSNDDTREITHITIYSELQDLLTLEMNSIESIDELEGDE